MTVSVAPPPVHWRWSFTRDEQYVNQYVIAVIRRSRECVTGLHRTCPAPQGCDCECRHRGRP